MSIAAPASNAAAWRQLFRTANVFTAASNVVAGFLIVQGKWTPMAPLTVLIVASMCLYEAGMVLNDVFDAKLDAIERPERPIPSGRIAKRTAATVGWTLLAIGVACSWWASWLVGHGIAGLIGSLLALAIVQYNGGLKAVWVGLIAMGWCRVLNVLLGASVARDLSQRYDAMGYALLVGLYTIGLTYVARSETVGSVAQMLQKRVTVTRLIQGFIVLDAIAATAAAGWQAGLIVLALLIPTLLLARTAPMT